MGIPSTLIGEKNHQQKWVQRVWSDVFSLKKMAANWILPKQYKEYSKRVLRYIMIYSTTHP